MNGRTLHRPWSGIRLRWQAQLPQHRAMAISGESVTDALHAGGGSREDPPVGQTRRPESVSLVSWPATRVAATQGQPAYQAAQPCFEAYQRIKFRVRQTPLDFSPWLSQMGQCRCVLAAPDMPTSQS